MRIVNYNNKNCIDFRDENGEVNPFQILLVGESHHGKGLSSESIAERWRKTTSGIVINLHDSKKESEGTFVMYEPTERYHLKELRRDGIRKNKYTTKLYHAFTFNLTKKGFLPDINFYTLSIKDMTKEDWSILAETDAESETIKLLERVGEDINRNASLFDFLREIERLTEGKKDKAKAIPDPKNWWLKSGGGTAKSVKQIGNMLSSFKKNYFLRKDTCEFKLNWENILLDNQNYHVFLTNFIDNEKLRNFLVECLLGQAVREAQRLANLGRLKKPILFLIPELVKVCPSESKGSSLYLAKALREHLVTMRSKASGMSCLCDTQIWSQTASEVRSSFNETFYGKLNTEDARIIFKAKSYTSTDRELFEDVEENYASFVWDGKESYGVFKILAPSHMHKERKYNWIQMYKKHFKDKMKRYDDLVKRMKKEFEEEEKQTENEVMKQIKEREEEERKANEKKESKSKTKDSKEEPKETIESKAKEYLFKRAWELKNDGLSDRKIAQELGIKSHKTSKKYYEKYEEQLKKDEEFKNNPDNIKPNLGAGVMIEEIEDNFDIGSSSESK